MEIKKKSLVNFIIFFVSQTLSQFGSSLTGFAIAIWAYTQTGAVMASSLLAICNKVPFIIVSLIGGSIVDRHSKKKIMLICDTIAAISTLIVLICLKTNCLEIWILYVVNMVSGFMNAFQNPASQVSITLLVDKDKYVKFGGVQSTVNSMLGIFSPILATALLSFGGLEMVIAVDLITFVIAFISLFFFISIPDEIKESEEKNDSILDDIKYGFQYMKQQKGVTYLMIIYSSLNFLGAISFDSMMGPLILARTNNNALVVGVVTSFMAVSGVLAGLVITFSKQSNNKIAIMFRGILIAFAGIMSFGLVRNVYLWSLVVLIGCFGMPFYFSYESAILREKIAVEMQGKLFAFRNMLTEMLTPVGYFLGALLADYIFEPFMKGNSVLRNVFAHIVGTGKGSGISLIFIFAGFIGFILTLFLRNNKYIKGLNN